MVVREDVSIRNTEGTISSLQCAQTFGGSLFDQSAVYVPTIKKHMCSACLLLTVRRHIVHAAIFRCQVPLSDILSMY